MTCNTLYVFLIGATVTHTVAEIVVSHLVNAGIATVFGLPGGENVQVLEALRRQGMHFVLVRNESSAVFMADATARLTGKPGVCLTTLGPGAMNAVAGVAHAYLERSPVLIISAQTPDHLLAYHTHQVLDLEAIFRPITKGTFAVTADNAGVVVEQALALATHGRPGPVHLRISNESAGLMAGTDQPRTPSTTLVSTSAAESTTALATAQRLLMQAQCPVIVVGVGLEPEQPYAALRELAEAAHAPVLVTPKAKGALSDNHPLAAGVIGLTRSDPAYQILDEADAIIAVGFDVVELVKPWQQTAPLIWLAPWANADPKIAAVAEFVGPLQPILEQFSDLPFPSVSDWGEERVARWRAAQAARTLPAPQPGRLRPQTVLQILRQQLPPETLVTTDVGSHKILAALTWPVYAPNRYLLSNGLSCMGYGLTAAIAGSLALNRQPTVAFTGDAGLAMVMGELALLHELQTPVIVVVFNDSALDLIRSAQVRAKQPVFGTEFINPNFAQIAAAYGLDAYQVHDEASCLHAIQTALAAGRPCLIEALIDPVSYPTTPHASA
jgi:acetolactate synthase-1/2/3 large subunit